MVSLRVDLKDLIVTEDTLQKYKQIMEGNYMVLLCDKIELLV